MVCARAFQRRDLFLWTEATQGHIPDQDRCREYLGSAEEERMR